MSKPVVSPGLDAAVVPLDAARERGSAAAGPCHLVNGQPPSCSQPLHLATCLGRFQREAEWRTCATGRYRCRYAVWGRGPTLAIVPGLCDDPWSFVLPMARLSEHFRCLAYSMPTGVDDGARMDRYRHRDLVADLLAILDHADAPSAYLLGVSFGSTVSLSAMHSHPERFRRGIVQGGFAMRRLAWAEVLLASLARWWPGTLERLPLRRRLFHEALGPWFENEDPATLRYCIENHGRQAIAAVARRALLLHHIDLRSLLPAIRQPLLVICGDRDPLVGKACEQDLLKRLPTATRAEIENCGHLPQFTHPEVLCEVVKRFLMAPDGSSLTNP